MNQIINGSHYNRALGAPEITLQVLFDLWFESFLRTHPVIRQSLNIRFQGMIEAHGILDKEERKSSTLDALHKLLIDIKAMNLEL